MKNKKTNPLNIFKPTLLLDPKKALKNLKSMAAKARASNVQFRPHFKTHQSSLIGAWFREFRVEAITVSSVDMAAYFADNGWKDITIAFPVNILEINKINELASKVKLNLLIESREAVSFLKENLNHRTDVWIKIDVGYHRTGVLWKDFESLIQLSGEIENTDNLVLSGLLTHSGHSYHAKSKNEITQIFQETVFRMQQAQKKMQSAGFSNIKISIGDTPTCSLIDDFTGVDEIRPGNFIFYDVMQLNLGACSEEQIAVAVACPVVAKHKTRNELVIYGGAIHLSKEFILNNDGTKNFGYIAQLEKDSWGPIAHNTYVANLSQEHGIIKTDEIFFNQVNIGDILVILPVHSCLTVNLLKEYLTLEGEKVTILLPNLNYS